MSTRTNSTEAETSTPAGGLGPHAEMFRALSEPIRLRILAEIAQAPEWPCTALDETLPVSKSTISYHVKILRSAGLIDVRKDGRHYHYRLRRDVLEAVAPTLLDELGR